MRKNLLTTHYLVDNHAACGCTKERKHSRRSGATSVELTDNPTLVGCAACERTKAHRAALAAHVAKREAEKAAQRESAKVAPLTLAIAEVKGISVEEAIDLPVTALSSDEMAAAIAKLA